MKTIPQTTLQFLSDLKTNNNRDWFDDHKPRYKKAKREFEQFIDELIPSIGSFDPTITHQTAKRSVFRIYRDMRFNPDKPPYKTNLGAHITSADKSSDIHSRAGYYIHIEPGKSMLAGGAYRPKGDWLKAIRKHIDENAGELKKVINSESFRKYFGEIEGEMLKTSPRAYSIDHPEIELLRYKSFLATHRVSDEQVLDENFLNYCAEVFKALYPFDQFLNRSIDLYASTD